MSFTFFHLCLSLLVVSLYPHTLASAAKIKIRAPAIESRFNASAPFNIASILRADQLRGESFLDPDAATPSNLKGLKQAAKASSIQSSNNVFFYTVPMTVGPTTGGKTYKMMMLDTGSANTWVGSMHSYNAKTATARKTGDSVAINYNSGGFSGTEYTDTVTIGSYTAVKQGIGAASSSNGYDDVDGILALGPQALSIGSLSPSKQTAVPTITDTLFAQKAIKNNQFTIYFQPTSTTLTRNGQISFGSIDSTNAVGKYTTVPRTKTQPSNKFWGVDLSITLGSKSLLAKGCGITDTGTSLLMLSANTYDTYFAALRALGAQRDDNTGFIRIPAAKVASVPTLNFKIGKTTFPLIGDAQFFPASQNTYFGGATGFRYGIVGQMSSNTGSGMDVMLGMKWLERFVTAYDATTGASSFALHKYSSYTSAQLAKAKL